MTDGIVIEGRCVCGLCVGASAEQSGMMLRCTCGRVLRLPDLSHHDPAAGAAGTVQLEVIDTDTIAAPRIALTPCPVCAVLHPRDAVLCLKCGYDVRTGHIADSTIEPPELPLARSYVRGLRRGGWQRIKQCELPLAIIVVGLFVRTIGWAMTADDATIGSTLGMFGMSMIEVALRAGFMFGAIFLIRLVTGGYLGPWPLALLKCGAAYMVISLLAMTMWAVPVGIAMWVLMLIKLPVYYTLMRFGFDEDEYQSLVLMVTGLFISDFMCLVYPGFAVF